MTKDTDQTNGVITTQNISTVIRPKGNDNSLQFVKIQTPELSKKAAEQIKIAQEINRNSKEKIKEVEEEWQNNLLNWKSKRRQQFGHSVDYEPNNNHSFESSNDQCNGQRKIKTFAEMLEQRAKSGNRRLSFHLQRYIGAEDDDDVDENCHDDDGVQESHDEEDEREGGDDDDGHDVGRGHNNIADQHCHDRHNIKNHHLDDDGPAHLANKTESSDIGSTSTTATASFSTASNNRMIMMNHEQEEIDDARTRSEHHARRSESNGESHNNSNDSSHFETQQEYSNLEVSGRSSSFRSEADHSHNHDHSRTSHNGGVVLNEQTIKKDEADYDDSDGVGDDEDDDDYEEEELEEEEEQKRLQRIAFEAKLRAFEKLTIPTSNQTPKFTPINRNVRSPQSSQGKASVDSNIPNGGRHYDHNQAQQQTIQLQRPQRSLVQQQQQRSQHQQPRTQHQLSQPSPIKQQKIPQQPQIHQPNLPQHSPLHQLPPQFQQHQQPRHSPPQVHHHHQQQQHSPLQQQQQPKLPQASPQRVLEKNHSEPSVAQNLPCNQNLPPSSQQMMVQQQQLPPPIQKHRNVPVGQVPPESPPRSQTASQQRKPVRDDKEGTVLSVSGKKRCSSCKEELGRGAAAFVVESLSLVYHTNCFRCSVCHVNLSNGFRGVDVRVHAGALHCQNCYSKDGLNYSRV